MSKLALTCLALAACSEPVVPAMHPASGSPLSRPAGPGEASVVFVRPPSSCDTVEDASIVDENGHFVGNAGANTTFAVTLPAGRHAFYVWPHVEPRPGPYSNSLPVAAVLLDTKAGDVARIAILVPKGRSLRCNVSGYELAAAAGDNSARAELESWSHEARPLQPDAEAGERDLERNRPLVCAHVELGRRQLQPPPPTTCGAGETPR
jgi:hypothetical protein